jgi:hypothetical protein
VTALRYLTLQMRERKQPRSENRECERTQARTRRGGKCPHAMRSKAQGKRACRRPHTGERQNHHRTHAPQSTTTRAHEHTYQKSKVPNLMNGVRSSHSSTPPKRVHSVEVANSFCSKECAIARGWWRSKPHEQDVSTPGQYHLQSNPATILFIHLHHHHHLQLRQNYHHNEHAHTYKTTQHLSRPTWCSSVKYLV